MQTPPPDKATPFTELLLPLAKEASEARLPFVPNPADYVGALQDPIHIEIGKFRPAKAIKVKF